MFYFLFVLSKKSVTTSVAYSDYFCPDQADLEMLFQIVQIRILTPALYTGTVL
jgi:hypothetical protein